MGNVCRLRNRRGHWIRTDIHPYFNPCPSDKYEGYGRPLPATDLVAHGGPTVVDALRGKPCPDDIDAVKCPHRDEQIAFNPYGQPVPYRAQTTKTTPENRRINWCRHLPAYFAQPRESRGMPHFSNKLIFLKSAITKSLRRVTERELGQESKLSVSPLDQWH